MALFRGKKKKDPVPSYYGKAPNVTDPRRYASATTVGNYALFAGGSGSTSGIYYNTVDVYDKFLTHFNPPELLTVARGSSVATTVGNYALFAGGSGSESSTRKIIDIYDSSLVHSYLTNALALGTSSSDSRFATTIQNSRAIFTNGQYFDAYDSSLTRVTTDLLVNPAQSSGCASAIGNYYLLAGGNYSRTYYDKVNILDISLTYSIASSPLSQGRYYIASTTIGDYSLFAGGYLNSYSDVVDTYNVSLTHSIASTLSVARYDMGATTLIDFGMFAGGFSSTFWKIIDLYDKNLVHSVSNYELPQNSYYTGHGATTIDKYALFMRVAANVSDPIDVYVFK